MEVFVLENESMIVEIEIGITGLKITKIANKKTGRNWIYSLTPLKPCYDFTESFDAQYSGGAEFLFPNDLPCSINNYYYPDHGFLWRSRFKLEAYKETENMIILKSSSYIQELDTVFIAEFVLSRPYGCLNVKCSIMNHSDNAVPYIFRFHPAFRVNSGTRFAIDADNIFYETGENGEILFCKTRRDKLDSQYLYKLCESDEDEFFCHVSNKSGCFSLQEENNLFYMEYDPLFLPYTTIYYFTKNSEKVLIAEPSTSGSAYMHKDYGLLAPCVERTYKFKINLI